MTRCPKCRCKYELGIYYCEPCQLSLISPPKNRTIHGLIHPGKINPIVNALSLRVILDADKRCSSEILVVKSLIESAGIACYFLSSQGRVLEFESSMDVERSGDLKMVQALAVSETDYEDAKAILEQATEEDPDVEGL